MDGKLDFTTLKKRLDATDGGLGTHLLKLEDTGYIKPQKAFVGKRPKTTYHITVGDRNALKEYLSAMQQLADAIGVKQ